MRKCTSLNGRHKWAHVKNFTDKRVHVGTGGTSITLARKGAYRCEVCGDTKVGMPVREAA